MDNRYYKRISSSANSCANRIRTISSSSNRIQKLTRLKRTLISSLAIPIAVTAPFIINTKATTAYASTVALNTGGKINSYNQETDWGLNWNPLSPFTDVWGDFIGWLKQVPNNIADFSVTLMADLYQLSTDLILKTPLWIFDNEWFQNTTYKFSMFAIGIVSVLTVVESIKRMVAQVRGRGPYSKAMDFKVIARRWFFVAGGLSLIPILFLKGFQGLNFISTSINTMGSDTINAVALPDKIKLFDVLTILMFDLILIASMVPILWKNGRRFFDIMVLGVVTPFALTAWIFDSYRHLFNQWWSNLKHLSLVQIYYAVFLLMLGWFLFGTPTPDTFKGMLIKMLVVVGGFARLVDPPKLVARHLDSGGGFDEVWSKNINKTKRGIKNSISLVRDIAGGPVGLSKRVLNKVVPISKPKLRVGKTRMKRFHKK